MTRNDHEARRVLLGAVPASPARSGTTKAAARAIVKASLRQGAQAVTRLSATVGVAVRALTANVSAEALGAVAGVRPDASGDRRLTGRAAPRGAARSRAACAGLRSAPTG